MNNGLLWEWVGEKVVVSITSSSSAREYKGTLVLLIPANQVPHLEDGISPDLKRRLRDMSPLKCDRLVLKQGRKEYLLFCLDQGIGLSGTRLGVTLIPPKSTIGFLAREKKRQKEVLRARVKDQIAARHKALVVERTWKQSLKRIEKRKRRIDDLSDQEPKSANHDRLTRKYKILIVHRHPTMREGFGCLLEDEQDLQVCGKASSIIDALVEFKLEKPDLVVTGRQLADGNGIELTRELRRMSQRVGILFLSGESCAVSALQAGADGLLDIGDSMSNCIIAIRQILKGKLFFSDGMKPDGIPAHLL